MSYDFTGKTALVTGAGRGIGKEVALQLSKYGANVWALSKTQERLDALKKEAPSIKTVCIDLADWKATEEAIDKIGEVELLVNNAGIYEPTEFPDITEDQFDRLFSVNVKSVINITQIISKKLREQNKLGSIVNVSSVNSMKHIPKTFVYSTTKAALDRITKVLAVELGPCGIRVNSVNPTVVVTDMTQTIIHYPEKVQYMKQLIPLRDFCTVEDVTYSILFLLSDKARMISGSIMPIDGGHSST